MTDEFEDRPREPISDSQFLLDLDGYEGPIDVLLTLARDQKVDLTKISILDLADQYLAFVARARRLRLELAADYLVMAAWLAYLKSRLLLPEPEGRWRADGRRDGGGAGLPAAAAGGDADVAGKLMALPQLGHDFFARGGAGAAAGRPARLSTMSSSTTCCGPTAPIATRRQQGGMLRILPTDTLFDGRCAEAARRHARPFARLADA